MNTISRTDAKQLGQKFFFTGTACKNGHIDDRSVATGTCRQCDRNRQTRFKNIHGDEYGANKSKQHYETNKQAYIDRAKNWNAKHPEQVKQIRDTTNTLFRKEHPEYFINWWKNNKDKVSRYNASEPARARRALWNRQNNGHKNFLTRTRQWQIGRATPKWADKEAIKAIYIEAARLSKETGVEYHVDHDIPLLNDYVCGLHVEFNLRIITKDENLRKGNKFHSLITGPLS